MKIWTVGVVSPFDLSPSYTGVMGVKTRVGNDSI